MDISASLSDVAARFDSQMVRAPRIAVIIHVVLIIVVTLGSFLNFSLYLRPWLQRATLVRAPH